MYCKRHKTHFSSELLSSLLMLCIVVVKSYAQLPSKTRFDTLYEKLQQTAEASKGLEQVVDFNVEQTKLTDFTRTLGELYKINISSDASLQNIHLSHHFSNAKVAEVLVFLCKNYNLNIDFTGNIMHLKKYIPPKKPYSPKHIPLTYEPVKKLLSIELKRDSLSVALKEISDATGENIVYAPTIASHKLSIYLKSMPLKKALEKLAYANNLSVSQSRDGTYLLDSNTAMIKKNQKQRPQRKSLRNFYFEVLDTLQKKVAVDVENIPIQNIIKEIALDLNLNIFTNTPLLEAGNTSIKIASIEFDLLLKKLLENTEFTFKKDENIYYFGKNNQHSVLKNIVIPLQHRSIEINEGLQSMTRNSSYQNRSTLDRNYNNSVPYNRNNNNLNSQNQVLNQAQNTRSSIRSGTKKSGILQLVPSVITQNIEVKTDIESNSFIVSGPALYLERFQKFIKKIDTKIPVILIEVLFVEHSKTATIETGLTVTQSNSSSETQGQFYPDIALGLNANAINKIIGGLNGFGTVNLGAVGSSIHANLKVLESNGSIEIKSTPKLATLNGHQASLAIGETTYYVVTNTDYIGAQIPQTTTISNYQPIDAKLALHIRPLVAGDDSITLSLQVIQSSFNAVKIDENAPPGMNSREFTSTIRVNNEDVVILGGLEEKIKNDSGTGVPLLSKIPLLKWLFSNRKNEKTVRKLSLFIKPTLLK